MIKIYTDGSCLGNPGNGGWAAIIIDDKKKIQIKGSKKDNTNNQMELIAPIKDIKTINTKTDLRKLIKNIIKIENIKVKFRKIDLLTEIDDKI